VVITYVVSHCSVLINTRGEVFACGWGADGQTGQGHYDSISKPSRLCGDVEKENIVKVATTADCNLAINGECHILHQHCRYNIYISNVCDGNNLLLHVYLMCLPIEKKSMHYF
jgi:hypothetical protein